MTALNRDLVTLKYSVCIDNKPTSRDVEVIVLEDLCSHSEVSFCPTVAVHTPIKSESLKRSAADSLESTCGMPDGTRCERAVERDAKGREVYTIEDVLEYCPKRGYLIKWMGWTDPTWNRPSDMPKNSSWVTGAMRTARRNHKQPRMH